MAERLKLNNQIGWQNSNIKVLRLNEMITS